MAATTILTCFRSPTARAVRVAAAMVLCASFVGAAMAEVAAHPEPGLEAAAPESVGVNSAPLIRMSEWIRKDRLDVRSLLIVKDGKLIFERYSSDLTRDQQLRAVLGDQDNHRVDFRCACGAGEDASSERVTPWILNAHPEFEDALSDKKGIELGHLMSMSSGLL